MKVFLAAGMAAAERLGGYAVWARAWPLSPWLIFGIIRLPILTPRRQPTGCRSSFSLNDGEPEEAVIEHRCGGDEDGVVESDENGFERK